MCQATTYMFEGDKEVVIFMADIAAIIPVGKTVLLSSIFDGENEIKTFIAKIYP